MSKEREYAEIKGITLVEYNSIFTVNLDPNCLIAYDGVTKTLDSSIYRLPDGKEILVTADREHHFENIYDPDFVVPDFYHTMKLQLDAIEKQLPFNIDLDIDGIVNEKEIERLTFEIRINGQTYRSIQYDYGKSNIYEEKLTAWPTKWININTQTEFQGFIIPNFPDTHIQLQLLYI
jgi:hypothetical protein